MDVDSVVSSSLLRWMFDMVTHRPALYTLADVCHDVISVKNT